MASCNAVPGLKVQLGPDKSTKTLVMRMAEIGVVKRLGKVDSKIDLPPEYQSSRSTSTNGNGYASIKE